MAEPRAQRTLVKSPPELWAEISDPQALARHLGDFGEIRIIRLEPETAVAWEGDIARGTVALEPSGWGTKVTLTATPTPATVVEAEAVAEPEPEPVAEPEPSDPLSDPHPEATGTDTPHEPEQRRGFFARLFRRHPAVEQASEAPAAQPEPVPEPIAEILPDPIAPPEVEPSVTADAPMDADHMVGILTNVLDDLGSARHRPFSRS